MTHPQRKVGTSHAASSLAKAVRKQGSRPLRPSRAAYGSRLSLCSAGTTPGEIIPSQPLLLFEILQARWSLSFLHRHQGAVGTDEIHILADEDVRVAFDTAVLCPDHVLGAAIALEHRPRPREGIVERGDGIVQNLRIGWVEINALLHRTVIICSGLQTALIQDAWTAQKPRLHLECVVAAAAG